MTSEKPIHFQTAYMKKWNQTYCGKKHISDSVKVTNNTSKVTCMHCRKYLRLD